MRRASCGGYDDATSLCTKNVQINDEYVPENELCHVIVEIYIYMLTMHQLKTGYLSRMVILMLEMLLHMKYGKSVCLW